MMRLSPFKARLCVIVVALVIRGDAQSENKTCDSAATAPNAHNVVLFITDGLRHDAVTEETAPTMFDLRRHGVDFRNSHSLFPTVTTANASAFATGHQLGDTGDFANGLYVEEPVVKDETGQNLSWTPFVENNFVLADLNRQYGGNYLGARTLEELAREHCYITAVVGKRGPAAIQAISQMGIEWDAKAKKYRLLEAFSPIIDDATGKDEGAPIPEEFKDQLEKAALPVISPDRSNGQGPQSQQNNGYAGTYIKPGTLAANTVQQRYFADVVTNAVLPVIVKKKRPFIIFFWSRDPDGTQHNQGDSLNELAKGINGPTSGLAVRNADQNLQQIIEYLRTADCDQNGKNCLDSKTDIIVAADHGFSTVSKGAVDDSNHCRLKTYASEQLYPDVVEGCLPPGFLAIDLARKFHLKLYDPDSLETPDTYRTVFDPSKSFGRFASHSKEGNALLGGSGNVPRTKNDRTDAQIVVTAGGGSTLIYLPQNDQRGNKDWTRNICEFLLTREYVNGIFVNDGLIDDKKGIPGTLFLSDIGLMGHNAQAKLPKPAIIVNFKSFSLNAAWDKRLRSRVEIADTTLQQGQGNHGNLSRADTFNNMFAIGPDFKKQYPDYAPVSNADIAVTIAHILGWQWENETDVHNKLRGRVMEEALWQRPDGPKTQPPSKTKLSEQGVGNKRTLLVYQEFADHQYYDEACLVDSPDGNCN